MREIRCLQFPNLRHSPWQLRLVPDPQLLGTGPNNRHIQQVTENQGFYQIRNFFLPKYSGEEAHSFRLIKKLGVRCTLRLIKGAVSWEILRFLAKIH